MMSPYVQNVTKWINHYNPKTAPDANVTPPTDFMYNGQSNGVAHEGYMNVAQVEEKGPRPPVPSAGPSAALRTVSPGQVAIQQAAFDAKREEIEKDEARGDSAKSTKIMKVRKTQRNLRST